MAASLEGLSTKAVLLRFAAGGIDTAISQLTVLCTLVPGS